MRAECTVGNVNANGLRPEVISYSLSLITHVSTGAGAATGAATVSSTTAGAGAVFLLQALLQAF